MQKIAVIATMLTSLVNAFSETPAGLFALLRTKDVGAIEEVLALQYVSGVTLYVGWSEMEPRRGEIDPLLTNAVAVANRKGKVINLGFICGRDTPEWVFAEGIRPLAFTVHNFLVDQPAKKMTAGDVWSPKYWDFFFEFIGKVARQIPADARLGYIAISGPSPMNGIEMNYSIGEPSWVPRDPGNPKAGYVRDDQYSNEFAASGYTTERFVEGWVASSLRFAKIFQGKTLALALHQRIGPTEDPTPARLARRRIFPMLSGRLALMLLGLDDGRVMINDQKTYKNLLMEAISENPDVPVGLQMTSIISGNPKDDGRRLSDSARTGRRYFGLNFKWMEIWYEDFVFSKNREDYRRALGECAALLAPGQ